MTGKSLLAAELSWPQVHAYRLAHHHLSERAPARDLIRVVGDIGGVQAQLMSAAEMQVGVRVHSTVDDVRAALWKRKTLVKTWLMRGTLHLVPAADLPLYTAAMATRCIWMSKSWLKFVGLPEPELMKLVDDIGEALGDRPVTRDELINLVGKGQSERVRMLLKSGWGGLLKPVARNGLLCFGPNRGQSVTFVRPEAWLGSWKEVDPEVALIEVARRYLRAYGPASKHDFARWWGNWPGVGNAAWAGLAEELLPVSIEGHRAEILAADLRHFTEPEHGPSVRLLPAFDPYVLGHRRRDHLFEAAHSSRVSRAAGWISAVVLIDGRVVATWTHVVVKRNLVVSVEPFSRLPSGAVVALRARARELAITLGLAGAQVKVG